MIFRCAGTLVLLAGNGNIPGSPLSVDKNNDAVQSAICVVSGTITGTRYSVLQEWFVAELVVTILAAIRVFFRSRSDTALEVLALRQQVAVLKRHP
jgi:hypothetical protein